MTNLYIDGVAVVLPSGFSIVVKQENAFFSKNGEYTYDIELSLNDPTNAKLYGFLNRLNTTERPAMKRKAVLIADNRVYLNGTEIITGWTDKTVSIQLVSGNSELNYFIGSDELISSLDMPVTNPIVNGTVSTDYIEKRYPEVEFNLMMTYDRLHGVDKNIWNWNRTADVGVIDYYMTPKSNIVDYDYIPQPYLCAYMRHLLAALGYRLEYNAIEDTPWRETYIVHAEETYKWNEMLPGWTAKAFLENVEKLFNGTFLIDSKTRTVSFYLNVSYLAKVRHVHLQNVVDSYTVETEEEEADAINSTIRYKFPESDYYKMRCLPEIVLQAAKQKTIDEDLYPFFGHPENQVKDTIFYYPEIDRKLIYLQGAGIMSELELVDEFAPLVRPNSESELELEILPAELTVRKTYHDDSNSGYFNEIYIPCVSPSSQTDENVVYDSVYEMVSNLTEPEESQSTIFLAFYSGLFNSVNSGMGPMTYPIAYTDRYLPLYNSQFIDMQRDGATFNLAEMESYFFNHGYEIDRKNPVQITCYDNNVYPASSVFEIFNRRFLAKEIEYTIGPNGRSGAWTGIFYPAKISDTEVEQRWILSDGKWRDGGVWLDEGRWLDN